MIPSFDQPVVLKSQNFEVHGVDALEVQVAMTSLMRCSLMGTGMLSIDRIDHPADTSVTVKSE
jgi:hypothetical protein